MTNPVLLLGTQSNGETLPVQVNSFGQLVAEGLQGPEGPQGPPGPEGPQGPQGPGGGIELPPDPYEGALLGWLNNELAWVGTPPIPIPEGVFGPITDWDPENGLLTVEGEIPASIEKGVYVWQCNADGTYFTQGWNTSQTWSENTTGTPYSSSYTWDHAFNGSLDPTGASAGDGFYTATFNIPIPLSPDDVISVYAEGLTFGSSNQVKINGTAITITNTVVWSDFTAQNLNISQFESISVTNAVTLARIKAKGELLVDTNKSLNMRVNQVIGQGLLGVHSATVDFTIGKYLYIPSQRVAPWVLYGNDPTSLIDHLRSS